MAVKVEIEGGTTLEFPDGTDKEVIKKKVKEIVGEGRVLKGDPDHVVPGGTGGASGSWGTGASGSWDSNGSTSKAPETSFLDTLKADAPAMVGATALGVAGSSVGVGLLPVAGLATLGGAAGESYKQIGQHLSGSLDAPKTAMESAKRIGKAGLEQGAWELVGGLIWKGASKIFAPFRDDLMVGVKEANSLFQDKVKPLFLPSEATESRIMDLVQNVAESSIIGGNYIAKYKLSREKFFEEYADNLIAGFGEKVDPSDLGELFVSAIEKKKELHNAASKVLYNNVSEMVGSKVVKVPKTELVPSTVLGPSGKPIMKSVTSLVDNTVDMVSISTKPLKEFAKKAGVISEELGGIEAKNAGDDLVQAIMELPETVGFDTARELRSRLISRVDEFSVLNKKAPAIGKAKRLIQMVDEGISNGLKEFDKANSGIATALFKSTKETIYHGRKTALSPLSKSREGVGVHFTEDPKKAIAVGITGVADERFTDGFLHAVNTDKKARFLELPDYFEDLSVDINELWTLSTVKKKLVSTFVDDIDDSIKISENEISKIVSENDLFKLLKEKGFDGIKYWDDLTARDYTDGSWSYILPSDKVLSGKNVATTKINKEVFDKIWGDEVIDDKSQLDAVVNSLRIPKEEIDSAYQAWRLANRFYKEGQERLNNTMIRRLIKFAEDSGTGSEMIAPAIFKPGQVSTVLKVKKAVDPQTWRKLQGYFMEYLQQKSTDVNGTIVGKRMLNNISDKSGSFGIPMMNEVLGPERVKNLKTFGRTLQLTQERQGEGVGKMLIQLTQAGAIGALAMGEGNPYLSGTIILGPALLSRALLNPRINRILTEGIVMPAGSREGTVLLTRLTAEIAKINIEDQE